MLGPAWLSRLQRVATTYWREHEVINLFSIPDRIEIALDAETLKVLNRFLDQRDVDAKLPEWWKRIEAVSTKLGTVATTPDPDTTD
jgi:hypothetical protein